MDDKSQRMVWIDLEMTGLDVKKESIIEIATVITDGELNILANGPNLAIIVSEELLAGMDEWNTTHHHRSGLVDRIRNEVSVLLVAGDWYGYDHYLRFGYGAKEKNLISALEIISPVLKRL